MPEANCKSLKTIHEAPLTVSVSEATMYDSAKIYQNKTANPYLKKAIQRGNASCVIGTVPHSEGMEEIFEFVTNHKSVHEDEESQM